PDRGHEQLLLALSVRDDGHLGQAQGRGVGPGAACARSRPAGRRTWPGDCLARRRDGQGDRSRERLMARAGLDTEAADAYRAYARAHPCTYAALQAAPAADDLEATAAASDVVDVVRAVLRGYGLD